MEYIGSENWTPQQQQQYLHERQRIERLVDQQFTKRFNEWRPGETEKDFRQRLTKEIEQEEYQQ